MEDLKGKDQRPQKEEVIAKHKGVSDGNSISKRRKQRSWDKHSSSLILHWILTLESLTTQLSSMSTGRFALLISLLLSCFDVIF